MESFNQIGPWITAFLLLAIVVFFCVFYVTRLLKTKKTTITLSEDIKPSKDLKGAIISKEQKKKLKDEIVHDIVADITPVLEKRLEKAF